MRAIPVVAVVLLALLGSAHAGIFGWRHKVSKPTEFDNNAQQLLDRYPHGGARMAGDASDLAVSDARNLRPLVDAVAARADFDQTRAIGFGLGLAMLRCAGPDQMYAFEIERRATSGSAMLADSFMDVMGFSGSELRRMVPTGHRWCDARVR
jgi:hypothetical protein